MTIVELQIVTCWYHTNTSNGCRAFIDAMADIQREAFKYGDLENAQLIHEACDFAMFKEQYLEQNPTVH